jgi:uncharacterized protein (TIGR03032 family)
VRYEHSRDLAVLLEEIKASLLISTYQAGKVAVVGSHQRQLCLSFHNFDRPMGVALNRAGTTLAVAARNKVWFLRDTNAIAAVLEPDGRHDACFLARTAHVTGEIQAHEMGWAGDELWVVNTLFSCLCTLHTDYSFVPRWQPKFISGLAAEDRCHLNGVAIDQGQPKYVTAMAETDTQGGWRPNKDSTGCLIDVATSETIAGGFAMPHSPRVHEGQIWLLDSGRGSLVRVDPVHGTIDVVARFPGYTRGLALLGNLAFVGLSKIRETSTFGGVPIAEDRNRLKCGVGILDLRLGKLVGQLEFKSGVEEVFDVSLIPNKRLAAMRGPFSLEDGEKTIWIVPPLGNSTS